MNASADTSLPHRVVIGGGGAGGLLRATRLIGRSLRVRIEPRVKLH